MIAPLLLIVALAQGAAPAKAGSANQQQAAQPSTPIVQNQQGSPKPQDRATSSGSSNNPDISQKALVWSAIVQAVAAVVVMFFTGALLFYSHRGWGVAKVAADAAKASAEIAERSLTLLNRGYVDTGDFELAVHVRHDTGIPSMQVKFNFINPSPSAFRIDHVDFTWTILPIGPHPAGQEPRIEPHTSELDFGAVVTPGQRVPLGVPIGDMNQLEVASYTKGGSGLVVQFGGRIRYTDIFKKTRHRRFARLFFAEADSDPAAGKTSALVLTPGSNDEEEWGQG